MLRGQRELDNVFDRAAWSVNGHGGLECQRVRRHWIVVASLRSSRRRRFSRTIPNHSLRFAALHSGSNTRTLYFSSLHSFATFAIGILLLPFCFFYRQLKK